VAFRHVQTLIQHGERQAEVDEEMAPLILWLWEHGFDTTGSCCDFQIPTDGAVGVYVAFSTGDDAERFKALLPASWLAGLIVVDPDDADEWAPVGTVGVCLRPGIGASTVFAVLKKAEA
jgi:hypothetical protein